MKKLLALLAAVFLFAGSAAAADKAKGSLKYKIEYGKIPGDVTLVSRIKPDYPKKMRQAGVEGEVVVSFTVSGDGTVSGVSSNYLAHPELARLAINAVSRWRFVGTYSAPNNFSWVTTSVLIKFRLLDSKAGTTP
jgi:TonB family protein